MSKPVTPTVLKAFLRKIIERNKRLAESWAKDDNPQVVVMRLDCLSKVELAEGILEALTNGSTCLLSIEAGDAWKEQVLSGP